MQGSVVSYDVETNEVDPLLLQEQFLLGGYLKLEQGLQLGYAVENMVHEVELFIRVEKIRDLFLLHKLSHFMLY